jgi:flagellar protein FlbB
MAEKKPAPAKAAGKDTVRDRDRDRKAVPEAPPKKKRFRFLLKITAALLVLLILAGSAVAAGVYFKLIDVAGLSAKYKLHEYPVIGKYFSQPLTNFETVEDLPPDKSVDKPPAAGVAQAAPAPAPPVATPEEIKANLAKAKLEETKRISRLARLYGEMKPDEAVPIMNQLDEATVLAIFAKMEDSQVAKILAQFDAKKSARLTQEMLKGKPNQPFSIDNQAERR